MKNLLLLLFLTPTILMAQNTLSVYDNLMGKTWVAEGSWGDGSSFKQEKTYEYSLDQSIVIVNSLGYTNMEQTEYGQRNYGIRQVDQATGEIKFWEYDVFGGLTEGTVTIKGKDLIYQYNYGGTIVTDYWEYVDKNIYNYTVGSYSDGQWNQMYLKTRFIATPNKKTCETTESN